MSKHKILAVHWRCLMCGHAVINAADPNGTVGLNQAFCVYDGGAMTAQHIWSDAIIKRETENG